MAYLNEKLIPFVNMYRTIKGESAYEVAVRNGFEGSEEEWLASLANGVSPTITVTDIEGGHRVTITDANGEQYFDVMDGANGGATGGTSSVQMARGSWTSAGAIGCGFKPDVVYITDTSPGANGDYGQGAIVWVTAQPFMETWEDEEYEVLSVTDNGFTVSDPYSANGHFTAVDHTYYYLAVKY